MYLSSLAYPFKIVDYFRLRLPFFQTQRIRIRLQILKIKFCSGLRLQLPSRIRKIVVKRMSLRLITHLCLQGSNLVRLFKQLDNFENQNKDSDHEDEYTDEEDIGTIDDVNNEVKAILKDVKELPLKNLAFLFPG